MNSSQRKFPMYKLKEIHITSSQISLWTWTEGLQQQESELSVLAQRIPGIPEEYVVSCLLTLACSTLLFKQGEGAHLSLQILWRLGEGYNFSLDCNSFWDKNKTNKKPGGEMVFCIFSWPSTHRYIPPWTDSVILEEKRTSNWNTERARKDISQKRTK